MSTINCDSCTNLRDHAPEFVQNGVTDVISASLKNNTGLNPASTVLRSNCDDLNDANDCLIGRLPQELEAYDVCEWKDFMGKFLPNDYEVLKGMIASMCGLWTRVERLCAGQDSLLSIIRGSRPAGRRGTWTEEGYAALTPTYNHEWVVKEKFFPYLQADILQGVGCDTSKRLGRVSIGMSYAENHYPQTATFTMNGYNVGDYWAYWDKSDIVPAYMTEDRWNALMRGLNSFKFSTFGGANGRMLTVDLLGYIVLNGEEYNTELKDRFGPDRLVLRVESVIGGDGGPFNGLGDINVDILTYDA